MPDPFLGLEDHPRLHDNPQRARAPDADLLAVPTDRHNARDATQGRAGVTACHSPALIVRSAVKDHDLAGEPDPHRLRRDLDTDPLSTAAQLVHDLREPNRGNGRIT